MIRMAARCSIQEPVVAMTAAMSSVTSSPPCLQAALDYLRRGWCPLALCPADHAGVDALHERTCTLPGWTPLWPWKDYRGRLPRESELKIYWNRNKQANVGIALGPASGLVLVLLDENEGDSEPSGASGQDWPETIEFIPPQGGRGLLYLLPGATGSVIAPSEHRVLGDGCVTPLPPSRTADGSYAWRPGHGPNDRPAALAPAWLDARPQELAPPGAVSLVGPSKGPDAEDHAARAHVVSLTAVLSAPVQWLWPGWIPLGKLTVLDGDPGLGKSTLLLDLAARISRGHPMPDGTATTAANITLLTAEDNLGDTVRPRLEAAGADLARVQAFAAVGDGHGRRPPMIPLDLGLLAGVLRETAARMLILDPFLAFLGRGVDSCKDQDVRRCLHRLAELAERHRCAIVLLRHLNKAGRGKAVYRGGGSIGIIGAARSGLLVAADPDSPTHRVLASTKSNLGPPPASLRFTLASAGSGVCRIAWCGPCLHQADDLVRSIAPAEERACLTEACDFLRHLLTGGPVAADHCLRQARRVRLSEKTLRRAKALLQIRSTRSCEGPVAQWLWSLPSVPEPRAGDRSCPPSVDPGAAGTPVAVAERLTHTDLPGNATSDRFDAERLRALESG
jgi:hypothetical protein